MIFCAVTGPMPGSVSSCSAVAALSDTGPLVPPPPAEPAAPDAPRGATSTCWPSASGAARLTALRSARRVSPPARATASATRAPRGSRYRPGRATAPATSTTISRGVVGAAGRIGATRSGAAVAPVPPWWRRTKTNAARATSARPAMRRCVTLRPSGGTVQPCLERCHAWETRSCRLCVFSDDDVDELVRHDDHTPLLAVQVRSDLLGGSRERDQLLLGESRRRLHAVAHLPVHLQDELDRLPLQHRGICLRPRLLPQPLVPERDPQLLGDVRRVRL